MRIALLTDGIHPHIIGGMQMHSFHLAKSFAQNKIYVDLYHPDVSISESEFLSSFSPDEIQYINVLFITFPKFAYFPGHYIYESLSYSRNIFKKYIENEKPDFIYAQGFCGWAFIKERKKGNDKVVPVGVNFHGLNMFQKTFGISNRLTTLLFKNPARYNLRNAECVFSLG
ncbi:MAG: glycosyltransferase, partial [Nitrosopumilus sp.]|nr:glycosyltransferase [Nitrosopumilus sp.]